MNQLLCLTAFFAPFGANFISVNIGPFKLSPFRICFFCALLWYVTWYKGKFTIKNRNSNTNYTLFFMIIWLFYAILTFFKVESTLMWLKNVYFIFIGVAMIAIVYCCSNTIESIKKIATAYEFGILIQGVIGWYEIITNNYCFVEMSDAKAKIYLLNSNHVPIGMMGNPNNFATLMFCGIVIAIFLFVIEHAMEKRIITLFMCINFLLLLFFTESRANMIAVLITIGVCILFAKNKRAAILFCMFFVFCITFSMGYINRALNFEFTDPNGSVSIRWNLIKTGIYYLATTYGFGVGAGQIESMISTYGSPYYIGNITNLHNWWVELLANYGIAVFVGYLVFYVKTLKHFKLLSCQGDTILRKTGLLFFASLIGFIIACISPSSIMSLEWWWLFMAIIIAYESYTDNLIHEK